MAERRSPVRVGMLGALGVLIVVVLVALLWELRQLVMLAFLALLVAAALIGPSSWLEERGWPRLAAVLSFYLGLLVLLGVLLFFIVPPLIEEAVALFEDLPAILEELQAMITGFLGGLIGADLVDRGFETIGEGAEGVFDPGMLLAAPLTAAEVLFNTVIVLIFSIFMLLERDRVRDWGLRFFKEDRRGPVRTLGADALLKLGAYVRGQLILMTIVGVGATVGMLILGVPFALPLGVLAFFAEAIPMAGPWIAGIPIVLIAFLDSPMTGILMAIWFVALQSLESYVFAPIVHGKVIEVSPMVVMFAILAGGTLAGVVGAIIAIPLVAVIDLVIEDVLLPLRRGEPALEEGAAAGES